MIDDLGLTEAQKNAVAIMKTFLDCYNSKDGTGMFSGISRYQILAARTEITATQSQSIFEFWAKLTSKMLINIHPAKLDNIIKAAISSCGVESLRPLSTETASIIALARMLHTEQKNKSINLADDAKLFNDNLEF
jgi:hypothetical protein